MIIGEGDKPFKCHLLRALDGFPKRLVHREKFLLADWPILARECESLWADMTKKNGFNSTETCHNCYSFFIRSVTKLERVTCHAQEKIGIRLSR